MPIFQEYDLDVSTNITNSFRILIESSPDGFFVHDATGRILDVNERSCRDLGRSRDELLGLTINDISREAAPGQNAIQWANAVPGTSMIFREIAVRKDGSEFPVEISSTCQLIGGRKLFLGLARNISERESDRAAIARLNSELELRVERRTSELREAREKLQSVMDSAQDAIAFQDRDGRYLVVNRSAERLSGVSQADAIGKTSAELFGAEIGQRIREAEESVLASGQPTVLEESITLPAGDKTFLTTRSVHRDQNGEITGLVIVARDVTELKRNEHRIRQDHDRLLMAARIGGLGVWDYDLLQDKLHCDEQWYHIMGRDPSKPIGSIAEFRGFIHPEDVDRATEVEQTAARLVANREDYGIIFRIIRPDGEIRWVRSCAIVMSDMKQVPSRAVGFVVDITEMRIAEEQLKQSNLSLHAEKTELVRLGQELGKQVLEDSLTGIANRRCLDQELERACLHAARIGHPIALAIIDVDFFKQYNDHYGHGQGDAALKAVAGILANVARRPYDLAARYGGEEFVLLLPAVDRPEAVLERIFEGLATLKMPHAFSAASPYLTVSCGCVVVSQLAGVNPADILTQSDQALYCAKNAGRNRYVVTHL